jgi:hypothetical protein
VDDQREQTPEEAQLELYGSSYAQDDFRRLLMEQMRREEEALNLYEPLPWQEQFHSCRMKQCIIQKGNQVGGPTPGGEGVLTPTGWVPIGELKVGDVVIGGDGKPCNVTGVFPQGWKAIFKLTFDDGASIRCCEDHYWKCKLTKTEKYKSHPNYRDEKWGVYSLHDIRRHGGDNPIPRDKALIPVACCELESQPTPVDPYLLGVLLGDGSISNHCVSFTSVDEEVISAVSATCGNKTHVVRRGESINYGISKNEDERTNEVKDGLKELGLMGLRSNEKFIPDSYLWNSVETRIAVMQGLCDTDGYCCPKGLTYFYTTSPRLAQNFINLVRSLGGKAWMKWKETFKTTKGKSLGRPRHKHEERSAEKRRCLNIASIAFRVPEVCPFRLTRKAERWEAFQNTRTHLRILETIEPAGNADCFCISVDSPDHTYVTRDYIVTHNTLCGAAEVARAIIGKDPYNKYPKRDGVVAAIGYGQNHIGRTFYPALFLPGQFKVIRDKVTKRLRAWHPWEPEDAERESETQKCGPLIPPRYVKKVAWDVRALNIFARVEFTTGWVLYALNSSGDPSQGQGFKANLGWIDEDLDNPGWYQELLGRLAMQKGPLRWTALPHAKNDSLVKLVRDAESQESLPDGDINKSKKLIRATIFDNPFFPKSELVHTVAGWKAEGEDVYRKRALGEFTFDSVKMYPTFSKYVHDALGSYAENPTPIQRMLRERAGEPPADWCRYLAIDPGWQICAVLFLAVPPPGAMYDNQPIGDHVVIYDELYLNNCLPHTLAEGVKMKGRDQTFESFIIDLHGARLSGISTGQQALYDYSDAFAKAGLRSVRTGHSFTPGSPDIRTRETRVREWLAMRDDKLPKLLVVFQNCPNYAREMEAFKKKRLTKNGELVTLDEGDRKHGTHAVECGEYLAAHNCIYHAPPPTCLDPWEAEQREKKNRKIAARKVGRLSGRGNAISLGPQGVPYAGSNR